MRARSQAIAFCPQLVTLIACAANAAAHRGSRCRLLAYCRPRLGRGIAATGQFENIILLHFVLLRRSGVQLLLTRELQLLESVLRALGKRVEARMLRLRDGGGRSGLRAGMVRREGARELVQSRRHDLQAHALSAWMRGRAANRGWTKFSEASANGRKNQRRLRQNNSISRFFSSAVPPFADDFFFFFLAGLLNRSARRRRLNRRRKGDRSEERLRNPGHQKSKTMQNVEKVGVKYGPQRVT